MNLTLDEMETTFSIVADDRSIVHIYSDDPVLQRRIEAVGATLVREEPDRCGKFCTLPMTQLSLRKPPSQARIESGRRLAQARQASR